MRQWTATRCASHVEVGTLALPVSRMARLVDEAAARDTLSGRSTLSAKLEIHNLVPGDDRAPFPL